MAGAVALASARPCYERKVLTLASIKLLEDYVQCNSPIRFTARTIETYLMAAVRGCFASCRDSELEIVSVHMHSKRGVQRQQQLIEQRVSSSTLKGKLDATEFKHP